MGDRLGTPGVVAFLVWKRYLTLVQVCFRGEDEVIAQNGFHHWKERLKKPPWTNFRLTQSFICITIMIFHFCQKRYLTSVQVCFRCEDEVIAQNGFHHWKERPQKP